MKHLLRYIIFTIVILTTSFSKAIFTNFVTFHYYTQDYLGTNRAVINGSTGAVEQTVSYYPYCAVIADLGNLVISPR